MRIIAQVAVATIVVLMFPAAVAAAGNMKPGLWEVALKSDEARQMPTLSPQQLEQMRRMGIEPPAMRDGAFVRRLCITKEMAEREQLPQPPEQSECKLKDQNRSANGYRAEMVCDGPHVKGTGTIKAAFASSESYTSTFYFKGTSRGQEVKEHHESSGKWLGSDCGNVKPSAK